MEIREVTCGAVVFRVFAAFALTLESKERHSHEALFRSIREIEGVVYLEGL